MYTKINFINDTLLIESFSTNKMVKQAQSMPPYVGSVMDSVTSYVNKEFAGVDKTKAVVNLLAPGMVFFILNAAGLTWIGLLVGLLMRMFKFDASKAIDSLRSKIMSKVSSGEKFTSNEVKSLVDSVIPSMQSSEPKLETTSSEINEIIKFAYRTESLKDILDKAQEAIKGRSIHQGVMMRLFRTVLSWFAIIALASTGFMVAGDGIASLVNKGKEIVSPGSQPVFPTKPEKTEQVLPKLPTGKPVQPQSRFTINPRYTEENYQGKIWQVNKPNTTNNIINTIFDYIEDVYPELAKKESEVSNTPGFKAMLEHIKEYNDDIKGSNLFFMPPNYKSKKQIADLIVKDLV